MNLSNKKRRPRNAYRELVWKPTEKCNLKIHNANNKMDLMEMVMLIELSGFITGCTTRP
jgi:hypothetical protein